MRRVVIGAVVASLAIIGWVSWPIPASLIATRPAPSVTLTDRESVVLRTTRAGDGSRARWIPLAEMDPKLIQAFVAVEDRRFFDHWGVDPRALARAARDGLHRGHVVSGASTITMQLARLLRGSGRTLVGKVEQTLWAIRLERHLSKQQILEQYLNRVDLGQGAVGVGAGAALYFNASATSLSVGQAALLAGLAHAPAHENPLSAPVTARHRRAAVLVRMRSAGYVTLADATRAAAEPVVPTRDPTTPFLAPHFTTRVLSGERAEDAPSATDDAGDRALRTSLDLGLQTALEAEVRATVDAFRDRGARQAAAVVLHNATGEILAWVGSPDFWADTAGQTDMVVSARQPGSALKPFLYGLAFDRGFTPASVLADIPHTYQTTVGPYRPRNYDRGYHGPVRAREALGSSYNVPAVGLVDVIGVGALLNTLRLAGFASLDHSAEHYGLGLALGNGDVTLLELANGYRALANGGVWHPVTWRATDISASDASSARTRGRRVMSPLSAALVLDVLSDPDARVAGFGVETPFDFAFPVATKTGTSRHFTDNWAVATTGGFTVAVWVGNFSGRPMEGVSGVTGAGPLLHHAVLLTARRYAPGVLTTPDQLGATRTRICRLSGLRATPRCPFVEEWFAPGMSPIRDCDWHQATGVVLPVEYAEWAGHTQATTVDARRTPALAPGAARDTLFRILSPHDGDHYEVPPGVDARYATVALRAAGGRGHEPVTWSVDGHTLASPRFALAPGVHVIAAHSASDSARATISVP